MRVACALIAVAAIGAAGLTSVAIGAKVTKRNITANGPVSYNVKSLNASAGKVTITMRNANNVPHNVAIKGKGLKRPVIGKVVAKGKRSVATAVLKAGTYTFYCTVPGHEAAGMKGVLRVKK